ncbi:sigma-70 family RNA polymerase sigma factor [Mycolicibacterium sp.]|uniref:sigma-70 family RNA polymerase sigma factor n=1 Tax=Mycolicibacterium sp. TaxID=2320850 RepID=UPI00355F7E52
MTVADLEDTAEFFTGIRHLLFAVARRMLHSTAEAEDIVQDAWLRWQCCDRDAVRNPTAFLLTTTTRLCLNELQSAHCRRETPLGPWLPEPVDTAADPALRAERADALAATRMVLAKLPPTERSAYVLREAFDYPYRLIAQSVGVSEPNARQLVSRARKHLTAERVASATCP